MQEEYELSVEWRGFQLHPEIPPGGVDTAALFGESRARHMAARMEAFAAEFGVDMKLPGRVPFTLRPLAATEFARDQGKLAPFRDALMDAHWLHGGDIESDQDLSAAAATAGLDPDEVLSAADDPAYRDRLQAIRQQAFDNMITAIPTFVFGGYPVVGCQTYETLSKVVTKLGIPRRDP